MARDGSSHDPSRKGKGGPYHSPAKPSGNPFMKKASASKGTKVAKAKGKQMPSHVGLVDKLKARNKKLEEQLKKLRGK